MGVLGSLKKLRELRLGGNPVSDTPALRYLVLSHTPRLARFDGTAVTEDERAGRAHAGGALAVQSACLGELAEGASFIKEPIECTTRAFGIYLFDAFDLESSSCHTICEAPGPGLHRRGCTYEAG